tara:strand:- start:1125 stop:1328 length:204 start_codon:yes stop_codon:yes gene_type:complete
MLSGIFLFKIDVVRKGTGTSQANMPKPYIIELAIKAPEYPPILFCGIAGHAQDQGEGSKGLQLNKAQ